MNRILLILPFLLIAGLKPLFAQTGDGLKAVYFTNPNLTSQAVSVTEPWLSFIWNGCPPQSGMSVSVFSVQWTGQLEAAYSEPYTFTAYVAGGVSVIVNGQTLISQWTDGDRKSVV